MERSNNDSKIKWKTISEEDDNEEEVEKSPNHHVILNVGGQIHETYLGTLRRIPKTRLGQLAEDYERDEAYDPETDVFFFNRNPTVFVSILQYYRTGELHVDHNTCGNAIKHEFEFWKIDPNDIEPCCWAQYAKFLENRETLKMLDDNFQDDTIWLEPDDEPRWRLYQRRLWRLIEDPSYTVVGKIFVSLSIFFVVFSVFAYILETHSYFRIPRDNSTMVNTTNSTEDSAILDENNSSPVWWLSCITLTCWAWFTLEFVLRFSLCPDKATFMKSLLNLLDLAVLLVMCFESMSIILVDLIPRNRYIRVLALARIIRIMKLMRHYRAFKVLVYTIKVSLNELALMVIFLVIGVVIFACLQYYVEPETFDSIPIGCWWALVTMTTVGYGDFYPQRIGGYVIGAVAAIFGVLTIAFTVPIVVNNFSLYYAHAQSRAKTKPKDDAKFNMLLMTVKNRQEKPDENV